MRRERKRKKKEKEKPRLPKSGSGMKKIIQSWIDFKMRHAFP